MSAQEQDLEPEEEPARWPPCRPCGRVASPGLECDRAACPWHREVVNGALRLIEP
jgi:hypothetical protein